MEKLRLPQIEIELFDSQRLKVEFDTLYPQLSSIIVNALGKTPGDLKEVVSEFEFVLAVKEMGKIVGFGGYVIEKVPGLGKVIYESGKMVQKNIQGKGYGTQITQRALSLHLDAKYLTFSTQNPGQILSTIRAIPDAIFAPIDIGYDQDPDFRKDLELIFDHTHRTNIDFSTGIRKGVYSRERFGDYEVDMTNEKIARIERRLLELGLNRDKGDGVFVMARLHCTG